MMKLVQKTIKATAALLAAVSALLFSFSAYYDKTLPDSFILVGSQHLSLETALPLTQSSEDAVRVSENSGSTKTAQLKLLGFFTVKNVSITQVEDSVVILGGTPFGVQLHAFGLPIVGTGAVDSDEGTINPSSSAGLKVGDVITSINGRKIETAQDIENLLADWNGAQADITFLRDGKSYKSKIRPLKSVTDGKYKLGLWVRDTTTGIGMMTFYDALTGIGAGLGHGICDSDSGDLIAFKDGKVLSAEITDVIKGSAGVPGELNGKIDLYGGFGTVHKNDDIGIYSKISTPPSGPQISVGVKQEVHPGKAQIYTTLDGGGPRYYDIEIERVELNESDNRNMLIKATDPKLLKKTGGIVQGMSGSPIIQDGKLIGAVTHVLVSDPAKGYGVFAEDMLATTRGLVTK